MNISNPNTRDKAISGIILVSLAVVLADSSSQRTLFMWRTRTWNVCAGDLKAGKENFRICAIYHVYNILEQFSSNISRKKLKNQFL
jgi:hypothetical protein